MKQNKTQFIADNYVDTESQASLSLIIRFLAGRGVLFIVEPWPDYRWRVYVKKDSAHVLQAIEDDLLK
jgi:hypothetical protein